jgi:hypothetical protein
MLASAWICPDLLRAVHINLLDSAAEFKALRVPQIGRAERQTRIVRAHIVSHFGKRR